MESNRPEVELKLLEKIINDSNNRMGVYPLPIIAVFTKYEDFRENIMLDMKDDEPHRSQEFVEAECERLGQEEYWGKLGSEIPFVKLERMHEPTASCDRLILKTMNVLSPDVVAVMLMAVQRGNLELSVRYGVQRLLDEIDDCSGKDSGDVVQVIVKKGLLTFPWVSN
ncbi:hypothetical protein M422DRAFT_263114 [Sphaerobolus stellatus SS14]|uniref:Uncharacterized protein n=1 Tax=Sphaerobolus stellatus (strain SS14) TaxID=990650 RepID=A0A0C9VBP5_SPHS4|nr:hypothetical protein M422DRAFT_263114 [Sphaerobolus stellatus SS14]